MSLCDEQPKKFMEDLLSNFSSGTPDVVTGILNAANTQNLNDIIQLSHKLKSYSYNLGTIRLAALAIYIEEESPRLDN